jgi:pilus assembly protein Flp/PilA
MTFYRSLVADRNGATAIEYGLIAGLIAIAIVGAVTLIGTDLNGLFKTIAADLLAA